MNPIVSRTIVNASIITGLLLLFTLVTGIWLSRLGRPLHGLLFNIHKLIAFGAVVYLVVIINQIRKIVAISPLATVIIAAAGLLFLLLFISGALLSARNQAGQPMLLIHQVAPGLVVIATAAIMVLLANSRLAG